MLFYQLPLNFHITYGIFNFLNLISTVLVGFLLIMYQVSNRNRLLRSTCYLCFSLNLILFINFFRGDAHLIGGPDCQLQAVILNYFYVALHAHFCFFMVNSCFAALNWSFFGSKSPEMRTTVFIMISWLVPMLPTGFAIWKYLTDHKPIVLPRHFYCAFSSPAWPLFRFWFYAFSAPGLCFSFYLLFCTWKYRQITFHLSKTTQIDRNELFRLFLAIFLYIFLIGLSIGSGGSCFENTKNSPYPIPDFKNPYINPDFCVSCDRNEILCSRLCPSLKSYLPVMVGCILFAMYGFGSVASKCYRRLGAFLLGRRMSLKGHESSRRSSLATTTNNFDMRRLSSSSSANNSQRPSLPFAIFSPPLDAYSSSCFSQILHPNLSVIHEKLAETTSLDSKDCSGQSNSNLSSSRCSLGQLRHHPLLPSIDEDLEVLYMSLSSRPSYRRQFHRRFSEPYLFAAPSLIPNSSILLTYDSEIKVEKSEMERNDLQKNHDQIIDIDDETETGTE